MKKLLATAIAGTLLVTATGAAMARPYHGYGHYDRGYHRGNAGAAIGLGLGLFALGAVIASSNRDYGPAYYAPPPPPPPPPVYRYGYDGYYYYGR